MALERNWRGPLLANADVDTTLQQFQALERAASPAQLKNWRFQQGLFRAYYDAYTRVRLMFEKQTEQGALEALATAGAIPSLQAIASAERILDDAPAHTPAQLWRERILELGAALFQSIGMQLSVAKYHAIAVDRGAALDTLDYPLNNRLWLAEQFARIRRLTPELKRVQALKALVEWENPGPGGFYDDLGSARQPHLVRPAGFREDPGLFAHPVRILKRISPWMKMTPRQRRAPHVMDGSRRSPLRRAVALRYTDLDRRRNIEFEWSMLATIRGERSGLWPTTARKFTRSLSKPMSVPAAGVRHPSKRQRIRVFDAELARRTRLGRQRPECQVSEVWLVKKVDAVVRQERQL